MRIFNREGRELSPESIDLQKGYTEPESMFIKHHEAIEAVAEAGHWATIAQYPNGGKDIAWVVDVPAVEAKEAWDEYEGILRFVEFTAEELAEQAAQKEAEQRRAQRLEELLESAVLRDEVTELVTQLLRSLWTSGLEGVKDYGNS